MPIALKVGASLTAVTVKEKVLESVKIGKPESVTVNVKFEIPLLLNTGETVAVQFGATPPKTTLATGMSAVLLDVADIEVAQLNVLSMSVIVKLIITGTSSLVV